ncbi:MAG: choice-of-anchor A family protein [Sphingomonas phyllosphaerae]|uniref:choice-of-anchor A family protein n=1 Tax=Sphingomonas phyllosphaerae TaxID=257003 RepID=UPI002FFA2A99
MARAAYRAGLTAALAMVAATPASAATVIQGIDALHEWNLVVLGDLKSSSEVEGRTFVGGNLSGTSSNYQIRTPAASTANTPALTVVGDVTGGTKNLTGGATVGGDVTSGFSLNGNPQTVLVGGTIANTNVNQNTVKSGQAATAGFTQALIDQRDALTRSMVDLSNGLSALAANSTALIASNRATFNAVAGSNGVAVFSLTSSDLAKFGEIEFNRNGADTVIVNVSGATIKLDDNFTGSVDQLGRNVIWNFAGATQVDISTQWRGSVLAPLAAGTNSNYIQGTAVFNSMVQKGEVHLDTYAGNFRPTAAVPEPGTWMMMLAGFGVLGATLRRRKVGVPVAA